MRVDPDILRRELAAYRWAWEEPGVCEPWVAGALPRIGAMLALLPEAGPDSALLELGAPPFFTSLALDRVWPGRVTHTGYAHDGARRIVERLTPVGGGPERVFDLDCFNVETDEFPYPDAAFDVVVFSELIEHLAVNPVWALSEIHRVLRPGGHVIVTTPNVLSLERLWTFLHGGSETVDRYVPLLGYGARHNREWHPRELRELLEETGFVVEVMDVCDLGPRGALARLGRAAVRLLLRPFSRQSRRSHVFVRARRGEPFRWRFPVRLYDHMTLYRLVRHPAIVMGENDAIQCADGWLPLEDGSEGAFRRVDGRDLAARGRASAIAYLRGRPAARLTLDARNAASVPAAVPVTVRVRAVAAGDELAASPLALSTTWTEIAVPLKRPPQDREELEVQLHVPPEAAVAVRRIALAG